MILTPGRYVVRAVDAAGNEDQNAAAVDVRGTCPTVDTDGGFKDADDPTTRDHWDAPADGVRSTDAPLLPDASAPDSSDGADDDGGFIDAARDQTTSDHHDPPAADSSDDRSSSGGDVTTVLPDAGSPSSPPPASSCECTMSRRSGSTLAQLGGLIGMLLVWVMRRSKR